MGKHQKFIRCMAYQHNQLFIAICLDLSLSAQADTMDEAISKLDAQVKDYLDEAFADPTYTYQLLNRPAPLSLWFKYYWLKFLLAKNGNKKDVAFFEERCFA